MRRVVIVIPDLIGDPEAESVVRQGQEGVPGLLALRASGRIEPLAPLRASATPEAAWLGLSEELHSVAPGPLAIAALGVDLPDRTVAMCLTLASLVDDTILEAEYIPTEDDMRPLLMEAERLATTNLTLILGRSTEHGLAWIDGSLDMGLTDFSAALGKPVAGCLPEGDGERMLRRFIDDSVNLLSDHELNRKRLDDGLPPLNILWPWGAGFTPRLKHAALKRGEPIWVESGSMRLAGLARLVGYRHGPWEGFVQGLNLPLTRLARESFERPVTLIVFELPSQLRKLGRMDELAWLTREIDQGLFLPLADRMLIEPLRVAVFAPSSCAGRQGLALIAETGYRQESTLPFDERALEDAPLTVPTFALIEEALTWAAA